MNPTKPQAINVGTSSSGAGHRAASYSIPPQPAAPPSSFAYAQPQYSQSTTTSSSSNSISPTLPQSRRLSTGQYSSSGSTNFAASPTTYTTSQPQPQQPPAPHVAPRRARDSLPVPLPPGAMAGRSPGLANQRSYDGFQPNGVEAPTPTPIHQKRQTSYYPSTTASAGVSGGSGTTNWMPPGAAAPVNLYQRRFI